MAHAMKHQTLGYGYKKLGRLMWAAVKDLTKRSVSSCVETSERYLVKFHDASNVLELPHEPEADPVVRPESAVISQDTREQLTANSSMVAEHGEQLAANSSIMAEHGEQRRFKKRRAARGAYEDGEAKMILELWNIHFPRLTFERQPARWAVNRDVNQRISLERKLAELHNSKDPAALSRGRMFDTGEHHLKFRLGEVECRMFYRILDGKVLVTRIGTNAEAH